MRKLFLGILLTMTSIVALANNEAPKQKKPEICATGTFTVFCSDGSTIDVSCTKCDSNPFVARTLAIQCAYDMYVLVNNS